MHQLRTDRQTPISNVKRKMKIKRQFTIETKQNATLAGSFASRICLYFVQLTTHETEAGRLGNSRKVVPRAPDVRA